MKKSGLKDTAVGNKSNDIVEHKGWKFSKPSPKEAAEIRRGVAEMKSGKVKTISSQDLIKHLEKL
jgi:hypothetical protein